MGNIPRFRVGMFQKSKLNMSEKNHASPTLKAQRRKLVRHIAGIEKNTRPSVVKDLGVSAGKRLLAELDRRIGISSTPGSQE